MDQNQQISVSIKSIIIIVVFVAILSIGGYFVAQKYFLVGNKDGNQSNKGVTTFPVPEVRIVKGTYTISGVVSAVSGNQISFEHNPADIRVARVAKATLFVRIPLRSPEERKKDAETFQNFMIELQKNPGAKPPIIPAPPEEKITIADVRVGDTIVVTTEVDTENLKEFTALEVKVMAK